MGNWRLRTSGEFWRSRNLEYFIPNMSMPEKTTSKSAKSLRSFRTYLDGLTLHRKKVSDDSSTEYTEGRSIVSQNRDRKVTAKGCPMIRYKGWPQAAPNCKRSARRYFRVSKTYRSTCAFARHERGESHVEQKLRRKVERKLRMNERSQPLKMKIISDPHF